MVEITMMTMMMMTTTTKTMTVIVERIVRHSMAGSLI